MERKVIVKPKSSKAKNRLANIMEGNPVCIVEQDTGGELFLASANRKYFMWVSTRTGTNRFGDKSDRDWEIIQDNFPEGLEPKPLGKTAGFYEVFE